MKDVAGQNLEIGDIVIVATNSKLTFHKVIRTNRNSVTISIGKRESSYTYPNGYVYTQIYYVKPQTFEDIDLPQYNNGVMRVHPSRVYKL